MSVQVPLLGLLVAALIAWAAPLSAADAPVRIGVLAYRGEERAPQAWAPTAYYLSDKVPGRRFEVVPYDLGGLRDAVRRRHVDFVLTNAGQYVELEAEFGVSRIATLKSIHEGETYTVLGAVVFTRDDRADISMLDDLRGKSFMGVARRAFGGFRMAWGELEEQGIDPFRDFSELRFSGFPQDQVVRAVRDGKVDAGTVRARTLQRMHREGEIDLSELRMLNPKSSGAFPYPHTTALYPEWPFARLSTTPVELSDKVAVALLQLSRDHPAARAAGIGGWTVPMDYGAVQELYARLQLGPYRYLGGYTLRDFTREYVYILALVAAVVLLLAGVTAFVLRLDRKVRRSEASLARAQKIAHLGNWEWDVQRNTVKWSGQTYHIFGLSRDTTPSFELFIEIVHPDDREALKEAINNALYHNEPFNIDHRILTPDGAVRIVNEQGEVELNDEGVAVRMTATVQDITERKLAEERIRTSEQEMGSILRNMQDTFFRISTYGSFLFISPSVRQLLGYSPDELIGKSIGCVLETGGERSRFIRELQAGDGYVKSFETRLVDAKGVPIPVSLNAHYYFDADGDVAGVEGTVRDITKLKNVEEDLYKQKERMQITLRSIGDGVITTDVSGVIDYMNPMAEELTGWRGEQAQGAELFQVFDVVDAATREPMERQFGACLSGEVRHSYVSHESVIRRPDGQQHSVELTLTPIRDFEEQVTGAVLVFHDVTDLRPPSAQLAYGAGHDG